MKRLAVALVGLVGAAAVVLVIVGERRRAPAAGDRWRDLRAGAQLRYSTELRSSLEAKGGDVASRVEVDGVWTVTALRVGPRGADFHGRLDVVTLRVDGEDGSSSQRGALTAALGTSMFFAADAHGAVTEVRPDRSMPAVAESILRSLVSYAQVVTGTTDRERWVARERDQSGTYEAEYARQGDGTLVKRKLRYVAIPADRQAELRVASSHAAIGMQAGAVNTLALDERLEIASGLGVPMTMVASLKMRRSGRTHDLARALVWLREAENRRAIAVDAPLVSRDVYRQWDAARTQGWTIDGLLSGLSDARKRSDADEANEVFGRLAALVRKDESAIDNIVARIAAGDPRWKLLVDVLAAAGSPRAQEALITLAKKPDTAPVQPGAVLVALSLVAEPTDESISGLVSLLDDASLGGQARLGLGSFAHNLQEEQPERAREVVGIIVERLRQTTDVAVVSDYLDALGNAGMRSALPHVEPFLQKEQETLREHAVRALRRIPGEDVDRSLTDRLRRDASASVRAGAALALRDRPLTAPVAAELGRAGREEPDLVARFTALKTIVEHLGSAPELRGTLEWAAANDPNPELRTALAGYAGKVEGSRAPN